MACNNSNQGKKAFHFEVAKEDVAYFKYLSGHAHRLRLDNKYFGKFAKFTATLSNNAPMSDCVSLRRCIQGYLNFHLSSTLITIDGIDNLYALEVLCNAADRTAITKLTLRDLLYRIRLESNAPLSNAPQARWTRSYPTPQKLSHWQRR
jgi:hypothetical protein